MSSRLLAAVPLFVVIAACQESATAPKHDYALPNQNHPVIQAESPTLFSLFPGDDVPLPAVRIVHSADGTGLAGVQVTFAFGDGRVVIATTASDGNVSASWPVDYAKSADSVVASAAGVSGTVKFKVMIVHKATIAIYELQSVGGKSLPITNGGVGGTWALTGGRYRIFDDGTYVFGYELDGKQQWGPILPYFKRDSTIEFYLDQSSASQSSIYANNNYLFSTGTLIGQTMSVKYTDQIDFEDETYVLKQ
jgi:hypothetical protein